MLDLLKQASLSIVIPGIVAVFTTFITNRFATHREQQAENKKLLREIHDAAVSFRDAALHAFDCSRVYAIDPVHRSESAEERLTAANGRRGDCDNRLSNLQAKLRFEIGQDKATPALNAIYELRNHAPNPLENWPEGHRSICQRFDDAEAEIRKLMGTDSTGFLRTRIARAMNPLLMLKR